ncbi:MAG TPA: phosphatase PAP2 family protein [Longimicrobiales bacterium]|nr:phosphatase PAP2 family protein [Longimicrobiales bacterium]
MSTQSQATADPMRSERRQQRRGRFHAVRDGLYSTLRFIARHVRGFWGALAAFVTVSVGLAAAAAVSFASFASAVEYGFTQRFDENVLTWLAARRSPVLDNVMLELTSLGNGVVLIMIVSISAVFLWLTNHKWSVYVLLAGVIGGQLLNQLLKGAFSRERPSVIEWVDHVSSPSFPSGHAMTSIIAYGSVAYLVGRLEATRRLRVATWSIATLVIVTIGFSRMYLGVHYPSDIVAGFVAGLAWLAIVASSVSALKFFAPRRPETAAEESDLHAEDQRPEHA